MQYLSVFLDIRVVALLAADKIGIIDDRGQRRFDVVYRSQLLELFIGIIETPSACKGMSFFQKDIVYLSEFLKIGLKYHFSISPLRLERIP